MKVVDKGVKINMATYHFGILTFSLRDHLNRNIESQRHGKVGILFAKEEEQIFH
jgi:hypothetical protein